MRSIPEKTLEHWSSLYLSSRFPHAVLWWPTSGEDVLADLPDVAASGPGKTLALELKTTEVTRSGHVLRIDAEQLERYLRPPSGPPLPIYYVFPLPPWTGALTSRSGATPGPVPGVSAAPPQWWRRRVGAPWFGQWLYVMSARSLSLSLPANWRSSPAAGVTVFSYSSTNPPSTWSSLFGRKPPAAPLDWVSFWAEVTRCGPSDGVRWRSVVSAHQRPSRVVVSDGGDVREWSLDSLSGTAATTSDRPAFPAGRGPDLGDGSGGNERVLLRLPDSALRQGSHGERIRR